MVKHGVSCLQESFGVPCRRFRVLGFRVISKLEAAWV